MIFGRNYIILGLFSDLQEEVVLFDLENSGEIATHSGIFAQIVGEKGANTENVPGLKIIKKGWLERRKEGKPFSGK